MPFVVLYFKDNLCYIHNKDTWKSLIQCSSDCITSPFTISQHSREHLTKERRRDGKASWRPREENKFLSGTKL